MKIKRFSKKLTLILICIGIITSLLPFNVQAQSYTEVIHLENYYISTTNQDITPYAPIIGWRYKVIDGKLYRRQYNYSTQQWIGKWELC